MISVVNYIYEQEHSQLVPDYAQRRLKLLAKIRQEKMIDQPNLLSKVISNSQNVEDADKLAKVSKSAFELYHQNK
jgi:hypothetical protein